VKFGSFGGVKILCIIYQSNQSLTLDEEWRCVIFVGIPIEPVGVVES